MEGIRWPVNTLCMARTQGKSPKRTGHFLRQWRLHRGLTLETVVERLQTIEAASSVARIGNPRRVGMTHGNLSRIERGLVPYNETLLDLLADIYQTDNASLIMRDPTDPEAIWSIWDQVPKTERVHAADVLRTFIHKKSG